jgi:DNA helicase-4
MFRFKNHKDDSFFNDIYGMKLDKYQKKVVLDDSDRLLVIAGAGSGKTLTIIAKIKYLIEKKNIKESEILCLSFTNETVDNLKNKVGFNVDVLTFHKLALRILETNNFYYKISRDDLINYIVDEYFLIDDDKTKIFLKDYYGKEYSDKELTILKNNIISMIKMIKCNNLTVAKIRKLRNKCINGKDKIFYYFVLSIYEMYEEELGSEYKIDFDDMIIYARELVRKHGFKKNYKYIIIDEYQDISRIRFELIIEILHNTNAKLMCVGDDYQAIYGFSGSNLKIFLDFFKYYPDGNRIDIKNTYRNSYELINTSVKFIKKNPFQLRKDIHAQFLLKNPIILIYYDDFNEAYNNLFNYLYLEDEKKVMVLARYNKDLEEVKKIEHKGIDIKYLTVHMAKGLEEESVVLIKFSNDYLGFPSKIENNRLLSLINDTDEDIPYAEERRLFYVALTRCKKRIYILVPRDNPSIFLKEIKSSCAELLFK